MLYLFSITHDFIKDDKFATKNWKGVIYGEKKKGKPALLTRACPPGLALASPDMSEVRVLIQFGTFQIQKWYFDEMT